jgi:hypothetical protein
MKHELVEAEDAKFSAMSVPMGIEKAFPVIGLQPRIRGLELRRFGIDGRSAIGAPRPEEDETARPIECDDFDIRAALLGEKMAAVGADVGVSRRGI